jgi:hypothetical protein
MALFIDFPVWPAHGRLWSHLVSDASYEELHAFAERAGVPEEAFEGDHYDVPQERYQALVEAGARPVAGRDLLLALQRSGLRLPKRRGERVLATSRNLPGLRPGARSDLLAGPLPTPDALTPSVWVVVLAGGGLLLVTGPDGPDLPGGPRDPARSIPAAGADHLAEQTGLVRPVDALAPCGYLRTTLGGTSPFGHKGPAPRSHRAFLLVRSAERAHLNGAGWARWYEPDQARLLAGHRSWWPLIDWLQSPRLPTR